MTLSVYTGTNQDPIDSMALILDRPRHLSYIPHIEALLITLGSIAGERPKVARAAGIRRSEEENVRFASL